MPQPPIEPLDADLWFGELVKLYARRRIDDQAAPDTLFRKAFYPIQLAPARVKPLVSDRVDEQTIEALLDCSAWLSAAIELFGHPGAVQLVRQPGSDIHVATIEFPGAIEKHQDCDPEPAKAILGAWCRAVASLAHLGPLGADELRPSMPESDFRTIMH